MDVPLMDISNLRKKKGCIGFLQVCTKKNEVHVRSYITIPSVYIGYLKRKIITCKSKTAIGTTYRVSLRNIYFSDL